jgi:hypothetical protein
VCLAAINAMDVGRWAANKLGVGQHQEQQAAAEAASQQAARVPTDQPRISALLQPAVLNQHQRQHQEQVQQRRVLQEQQQQQQQQHAAAARLSLVTQQAVARFWELLQDFVAVRAAPEAWLSELAVGHPFLQVVADRLVVHCVVDAPGAV